MNNLQRLKQLYEANSKHSNYQMLSTDLKKIIPIDKPKQIFRYETERLAYVQSKINLANKNILDIGGNTGYFTFESLAHGAKHLSYFEGNQTHAEFVRLSSTILCKDHQIDIKNEYFSFNPNSIQKQDIAFVLNVLHHVGDDYGDTALSKSKALDQIKKSIQNLASLTNTAILQIGFNWKGNKNSPLFQHGTKREMINFVKDASEGFFDLSHIGIAEQTENGITYKDANDNNLPRFDHLGEFLNRPIFILTQKK